MNVLVADEHVLVRQGLQGLLKSHWSDATIHCVDNAVDAVRHIYGNDVLDALFINLYMLGEHGFDILDKVIGNHAHCYVALLLLSSNTDILNKAYSHGVHASISTCSEASDFQELFRHIDKHERYFPALEASHTSVPAAETASHKTTLTSRQNEVLALLLKGLSNKEIARQLNISHETVKVHVSAVMRYFHARNRTEVAIAVHHFRDDPVFSEF